MAKDTSEPKSEMIAEAGEYLAWRVEEPDGEITYHLDINNVTVHFFKEEWKEFLELIRQLV